MFVKGLEKPMILLSRAWTKILGTLFVKGLERTWDLVDKGLDSNLIIRFSFRFQKKTGNLFRQGSREHLGTFFVKGLGASSELFPSRV